MQLAGIQRINWRRPKEGVIEHLHGLAAIE
jgi:hypothetical protein